MKIVIFITLFLGVGFCAWLYTARWTGKHQERNVGFHVSGVVVDALTKRPLNNVEVRVWCREAKTSDHKLRGKALISTNYVVKTGDDGVFILTNLGGSISLGFDREGFERESTWSYRNREDRSNFATNLVIELTPNR